MDKEKPQVWSGLSRTVLVLASLIICVAGLKAAQTFFVPVMLAFFVAIVSYPVTKSLSSRKVPTAIAVMITVLVDFAFIAGVIVLGVVLLGDLQSKWEQKYAGQLYEKVSEVSEGLATKLESWGVVDAKDKIQMVVDNNLTSLQQIEFERVLSFGTGVLGQVLGFFGITIIFLILTIFMLLEADRFSRRLHDISKAKGPDIGRMLKATRDIQRYLAIKTVVSLLTGFLAGLLCWAAGLDFYLLWGIVAFALNFIPVIGSLVAGIPPVILALVAAGTPNAILVAGGYLLINNLLGNFVEPMIVGKRFGISTLVVIISVMFWGWVWGPFGMLLAVPITMTLKVFLDGSDELRWLGVAIAGRNTHPPMAITQKLEKTKEPDKPHTAEGGNQVGL